MKKEDPYNGYYNPNDWVVYPLYTTNNQGFGHCSNHLFDDDFLRFAGD